MQPQKVTLSELEAETKSLGRYIDDHERAAEKGRTADLRVFSAVASLPFVQPIIQHFHVNR